MELFKNTNYDFLGKKWPFIIASLILTAAGLTSLAIHGGPQYGIDFRGGAEIMLKFNQQPPLDKIRAALSKNIKGEFSVVQRSDVKNEVLVGTEIQAESQLNQSRQQIEDTLRTMFADPGGKLDVNNSSAAQLADRLRGPLLNAGVPMSEQELNDVVKEIEDYRASKGGILNSFDELSSVKGVTPKLISTLKQECNLGPFTILSAEMVGPKIGADLKAQGLRATLFALAGMLVYIAFRFEWI
jgi:preprotein translocase subunit SecF